MGLVNEHLSGEQIEELLVEDRGAFPGEALSNSDLREAQEHLAKCQVCQKRLCMYRSAQESLAGLKRNEQGKRGPECPAEDEWRRMAAGLTGSEEASDLVHHAAQCDYCGALLRQATEDFADDVTAEEQDVLTRLATAQVSRQKELAERLSAASRHFDAAADRLGIAPSPKQRLLGWPRWAVAASALATLAVLAFGTWWWLQPRVRNAERLLAEAYTAERTVEMRIPGARYAPLATQRGKVPPRSELALLKAKLMIENELAAHPNGAAWMAAQGRAQLLEGRFQEARTSLEHALEIETNSPSILTDLATVYFQIAQQEGRDDFYQSAAAKLNDVLKARPDDPIALFNRAIVYEHIGSYPLAIEDWQHYLRVDPQSDWALQEAQQRLERLRKLLKSKQTQRVLPADPIQAAQWLESRIRGEPAAKAMSVGALDEEYLEIAGTRWLPALFVTGAKTGAGQAMPEWRALSLLARVLEQEHGDRWISDLLVPPWSGTFAAAVSALSQAFRANAEGDPVDAEAKAIRAEKSFRAAGNVAGMLRSRLELVYAFHREVKADRCLAVAGPLGKEMERHRYVWAQAQLLIEEAVCWSMKKQFRAAQEALDRALVSSRNAHYGTLNLRAVGIAAAIEIDKGNARAAWRLSRDGLERYWNGPYPPMRAYQFFAGMAFAAEASRQWNLAEALAREAVMAVVATPSRSLEAMARYRLATAANLAGARQEAQREFERASQLFAQFPPNQSILTYEMNSQLGLAELEARDGHFDPALARLQRLGRALQRLNDDAMSLRFYRTLGEALSWKGEDNEAEKNLGAAVAIAERGLTSLTSDRDRLSWDNEVGQVYRALVRLKFQHQKDFTGALDLWEWYRAFPVRFAPAYASPIAARHPSRSQSPIYPASWSHNGPLPAPWKISGILPTLDKVTVVSYAQFPEGLAVWLFDDRGIQSSWVAVRAEDFEQVAKRFAEQCASRDSSLTALQRDSQQLYHWLITPVESRLSSDRTLVFETDGSVSQIPMQALMDTSGKYLGSRYAVVISPGLGYIMRLRHPSAFSPRQRALVVGTPTIGGEWAAIFPPLPDAEREAQAVAAEFENAKLLSGKAATLQAVARALPTAEVFHFAGHAVVGGGPQRGLLLALPEDKAGANGEGATLLSAEKLGPSKLRRCQLVVLSACSTATGQQEGLADPESLVRAFLLAGVPHVVSSRWAADSTATAVFMGVFYSHLLAGDTVATALQLAAEQVRQDAKTTHPYYWAAFNVFGCP